LILAFVVFNPGDLYYMGYKKTITIIIATTMFMVAKVIATVHAVHMMNVD